MNALVNQKRQVFQFESNFREGGTDGGSNNLFIYLIQCHTPLQGNR